MLVMLVLHLLGIASLIAIIMIIEWPKIEKDQHKEKRAFVALSVFAGCMLAVVLSFPELPGPNKWMLAIFKPFRHLLEP